jgi:magnesium chelatase subunit I
VRNTPALSAAVAALVGDDGSDGVAASAVELVLEGLHLSKRLNKDSVGGRASYRARA